MLHPSVSWLMADLGDEHHVVEVHPGCPDLAERPLRDITLPEKLMIVLARREGDAIYPRGATVLRMGNHLTLIGPIESASQLARRCRGR